MNSKRIAILGSRGIPAQYGGFETFAEQIAIHLAAAGHEVTVYCERGEQTLDSYRGVRLEYVTAPRLGPFSTIVFDVMCLLKAMRRFDIVYMLGYGAALFCFLPRLAGAQVWINMDGVEWRRSKWSGPAKSWLWLMENAARFTASRLIADAEGISGHLNGRYQLHPPISTIAYGAELVEAAPDPGCLTRFDVAPSGYYLVVCRLEPENHVLEIIDGYLDSETDRPLLIVGGHEGEHPYLKALRSRASDKVRFIGTIYDPLLLRALRFHCYGYFHGHSVGGTNPSLLEALGCGNPVLAHDNLFNREVAADAGLYFTDEDAVPGLVDRLERESGLRECLCDNAYRRIREAYTWDRIAEQYLALIEIN